MTYTINDLKSSPMFNLSLSSKELFHSNMLAWIAEDGDTRDLFVNILELFGLEDNKACELADGIRDDKYMVLREYKNFDFCICEKLKNWDKESDEDYIPGRIVLVLENKFKSIPYEAQLNGYKNVIETLNTAGSTNSAKSKYFKENGNMPKKWSKKYESQVQGIDCHFVLLTLSKDVCGLQLSSDGKYDDWHVVSYGEYTEKLLEDKTQDFKRQIICDYAHYVKCFCEYINANLKVETDKPWKKVLCSNKDLLSIRMDDIWQKLIANIILAELRKKGVERQLVAKDSDYVVGIEAKDFLKNNKKGDVFVAAGFSRGTALVEMKVHLGPDESNDACLFGVQIQNGYYKRFLESYSDAIVKCTEPERVTSYENKLKGLACLNLFRYDNSIWKDNDYLCDNVCPKSENKGKVGLKGFGGYGLNFLAQWRKISDEATVEQVIEQIIADCDSVKDL